MLRRRRLHRRNAESSDFPATAGAFNRTYDGGLRDAIIAELDSAGSALLHGTFPGSSGGGDEGHSRIAAILLLQPALDTNYFSVADSAVDWSDYASAAELEGAWPESETGDKQ